MTAWYRRQGMTLAQGIDALYAKYGCFRNDLASFTYEGADGMAKMQDIMDHLRSTPPTVLDSEAVTVQLDYLTGANGLPKSNVLEFSSANLKVLVRPSGTEPKIKIYLSARAQSMEQAAARNQALLDQLSHTYLN